VFVYIPAAAAEGTSTCTENVQVPPAGKLPPLKLIKPVPESVEPDPHTSFIGRPTATRPVSAASRLLSNLMALAPWSRLRLLIAKSSESVAPGGTGSPEKNPLKFSGSTLTSSTALAFPLSWLPGASNESGVVVLPMTPAMLVVTSTLAVQLAPPLITNRMKLISLPPASAVRGGPNVVSQVVLTLGGVATTIPAGSTFRKNRFCSEVDGNLFVIEYVTVLVPPIGTTPGEKAISNPGKVAEIDKVAFAGPPFPALEVTSPDTFM
jgi:hypothetical protein